MDKRKHPRIQDLPLEADISDGTRFFSGYVDNISRFGICLRDVPNRLDHQARRISVVLSCNGSSFKMMTRPCWTEQNGSGKSVGLEILNAPWQWTEFVIRHEPVNEDPWGEAFM